ncbi:hypothetical protein H0X06_02340 [Candidatus Dependentiae bacterium]|nr:hypothetical protein [Candidatus Dependentiae bacterium]
MNKMLTVLALLSFTSLSHTNDFSPEDRSELARLDAELRSKEQQYGRLQEEIAKAKESLCRLESAAHVRAASSVKKTYSKSDSSE